jgi:hypothetical protein
MAATGSYKDAQGRKIMETTELDAAVKFFGFQPAKVAERSERLGLVMQDVNLHKDREGSYSNAIAQAIVDRNAEARTKAWADLAAWNASNPGDRIMVTPAQIQAKVRAWLLGGDERYLKTVPREMRAQVRQDLIQ